MKICIIGGGWVGCHLANKLKSHHEIILFEKNDKLFRETSYKNQNRLHLGYHYARNLKTRELCLDTFDLFIADYGKFTEKVKNNLYCVPNKDSLIDFGTYLKIFDAENKIVTIPTELLDIEGCVNTKERHISFQSIHDYFNLTLAPYKIRKEITESDIDNLQKEFDLVIDCTNNHLICNDEQSFYEPTISLVYEKISPNSFDALTLVDGDLFSIYPYKENLFTVTDVIETPLGKFWDKESMISFLDSITQNHINKKITQIEKNVLKHYPFFLKDFTYKDYFISTKIKIKNKSDYRAPIIKEHKNFIQCFTGKIQGVYLIEDYIKTYIEKHGTPTTITPIQILS